VDYFMVLSNDTQTQLRGLLTSTAFLIHQMTPSSSDLEGAREFLVLVKVLLGLLSALLLCGCLYVLVAAGIRVSKYKNREEGLLR
jgi:hypothetical protein